MVITVIRKSKYFKYIVAFGIIKKVILLVMFLVPLLSFSQVTFNDLMSIDSKDTFIKLMIDSEYSGIKSDVSDIVSDKCQRRQGGKGIKFKLSTIIVYNDFILTAFSKFDEHDMATLTMPEYIEFLINFWDRINRVYAQKSVTVPIFGSGITRIKEHKNIGDEELLKIMLWTFKLSEMKFKHPAKLTIIIHEDKISQINLFNIKSIELGF